MRAQHSLPLLLLLTAGCEELEPFLPTVSFQDFSVNDIDFEHVDVDFQFAVDNPNPIDVQLASFSYELGLMDVELLSGDNQEGFELEAIGSSALVLPVDLAWQTAWDAVDATRGEDFVDFGLSGHFGFDTPIGEAPIPYSEEGSFPALRTPKFAFKNVRVRGLDILSGTADLEVDLGIDNDHQSTLFFDDFDYDVSLGGRKVADGLIPSLAGVEGATEELVSLPVEVNLASVGTQVYEALVGGGRLDVGLDATSAVQTPFGVIPLSIDEQGNVEVID